MVYCILKYTAYGNTLLTIQDLKSIEATFCKQVTFLMLSLFIVFVTLPMKVKGIRDNIPLLFKNERKSCYIGTWFYELMCKHVIVIRKNPTQVEMHKRGSRWGSSFLYFFHSYTIILFLFIFRGTQNSLLLLHCITLLFIILYFFTFILFCRFHANHHA